MAFQQIKKAFPGESRDCYYERFNLAIQTGVGGTQIEVVARSENDTSTPDTWWYIGGGAVLAIGITAAVVMRNRD